MIVIGTPVLFLFVHIWTASTNVLKFPDHAAMCQIIYCSRANGAKRRSGRKPGARVTNSARLFTRGKMRTQRSAKFINDCGRITLAHRWTSLISNIWRTARSGKGKDPKKYMKERLHNTKKSFFNLPLKE